MHAMLNELAAAFAMVLSAIGVNANPISGPTPRRVVSLNLCADQYLMALADPGQIAALTQHARDPFMSATADRARAMPYATGNAEEVLALQPDLVIASPTRRRETLAILGSRNIPIFPLSSADSYVKIRQQMREVAKMVGHVDRGEKLVAEMDREMAGLPRAKGKPVIAYYQRRGFLTGGGTLVDDLIKRAGGINLATTLGRGPLSRLSLEEMAAARPDFLILESSGRNIEDQGTEMLQHPVLSGIARLYLPHAWTVCGGPAFIKAAKSLAGQLQAQQAKRDPGPASGGRAVNVR